ncbi:MAG TPA: hypothetical protein VGI60_09485 [Chthoniobacterales bacterium]
MSRFSGKLPYDVGPSSPAGRAMTDDVAALRPYNFDQLMLTCLP